jgi:hypothetical protein
MSEGRSNGSGDDMLGFVEATTLLFRIVGSYSENNELYSAPSGKVVPAESVKVCDVRHMRADIYRDSGMYYEYSRP